MSNMDDDMEVDDILANNTDKRYEKLGFRPQKEIWCNRIMPYAEIIDNESTQMLNEIKTNLGRAIALSDLDGISLMAKHLNKYVLY